MLKSILDVPMKCADIKCRWKGLADDCIPDIDGDGSLGCPRCGGTCKEIIP